MLRATMYRTNFSFATTAPPTHALAVPDASEPPLLIQLTTTVRASTVRVCQETGVRTQDVRSVVSRPTSPHAPRGSAALCETMLNIVWRMEGNLTTVDGSMVDPLMAAAFKSRADPALGDMRCLATSPFALNGSFSLSAP